VIIDFRGSRVTQSELLCLPRISVSGDDYRRKLKAAGGIGLSRLNCCGPTGFEEEAEVPKF
jgi:hypothetical protein